MGIYDRPYYRDDQPPGFSLVGHRSMVANLIIINVVIALVDFLAQESFASHKLSYWLSVSPELLTHPWNLWKLATYGFAHASLDTNPLHIVFNMYMLWLFGRDIEGGYGLDPAESVQRMMDGFAEAIELHGPQTLSKITFVEQDRRTRCESKNDLDKDCHQSVGLSGIAQRSPIGGFVFTAKNRRV